jgi:hypothetical protein
MEELALRMYFFVPYNISEIQKSIQAGHSSLEYAYKFGETNLFKNFMENHKTWIILNGGTTRTNIESPGSMQEILSSIFVFNEQHPDYKIKYSIFHEPDLNDAMTAICFICDERVWNYKDYPDFVDYMINIIECDTKHFLANYDFISIKTKSKEELQQLYPEQYNIWLNKMGGEPNIFLRELLKGKKLA